MAKKRPRRVEGDTGGSGGSENEQKKLKQQQNQQQQQTHHSKKSVAATGTSGAGNTSGREEGQQDGIPPKGKGKRQAKRKDEEDDKRSNAADDQEAVDKIPAGRGGGKSKKRLKKEYDNSDYEGPIEEEDSDSDTGNDDDDDDDDSEDDIKLDGAITRGSEEEFSEEEGGGEPGDDDEEKDGPGSQAGADQQTLVDINLDFCDPHERFFHGIKALAAHSYLQDATGPELLSPLVDLSVEQGAVGTILSTDGEEDAVFGFLTALPLRYLARENKCAQSVTKYLLQKAFKAERGAEMEAVIGKGATGKVGLLVNERMINCPMQAVPKLFEALTEDIAWAVENEISEEHRDKFRFDKFVVVAPCDDAGAGGPTRVGSGPAMLSDFHFFKFDDEILLQEADFFFPMSCATMSSGGSASGNGGGSASGGGAAGHQRYVVGVIPADKLGECAQGMKQLVG